MKIVCVKCGIEKEESEYGKSPLNKNGSKTSCKQCWSDYFRNYRKYKYASSKKLDYLNLNGATKEDYEAMYEIMKKLGDDPTGNISQQFCDKYGLKYKERNKRHINAFPYNK